jgi:hypothetical protein
MGRASYWEDQQRRNPRDLKFPDDFLNLKCVVYTASVALAYWFLPRNAVSVTVATVVAFMSVNWYGHVYNCIWATTLFSLLYSVGFGSFLWLAPVKSKALLVSCLYFPYFLLAWYDFFANCAFRMNPTVYPFGRFVFLPVKPEPYKRTYDELDPVVKANIANFDKYLFVTLIAGGLGFGVWRLL